MSATRRIRDINAEARAVEEGHHAILLPGGAVKVVSDSKPGKWFRVTFTAVGGSTEERPPVVFRCEPVGKGAFCDDHGTVIGQAGSAPCKHAALAARKLERHKLAAFDGLRGWVSLLGIKDDDESDPFEGLPS